MNNTRAKAIIKGYRSGLEDSVGTQLQQRAVPYKYEAKENKISYIKPASNHTYSPDFTFPECHIIVETKGIFDSDDRKKHLLIKEQHPHLDIRFVFSNPDAKIRKGSKTRYRDWCDKHGFKYAKKTIPQEWLDEIANIINNKKEQ